MATTTSHKRSAQCVQCGTDSIFPRFSKNERGGKTAAIWHCPVCGHEIDTKSTVIEKAASDAERIEEFFSRFC